LYRLAVLFSTLLERVEVLPSNAIDLSTHELRSTTFGERLKRVSVRCCGHGSLVLSCRGVSLSPRHPSSISNLRTQLSLVSRTQARQSCPNESVSPHALTTRLASVIFLLHPHIPATPQWPHHLHKSRCQNRTTPFLQSSIRMHGQDCRSSRLPRRQHPQVLVRTPLGMTAPARSSAVANAHDKVRRITGRLKTRVVTSLLHTLLPQTAGRMFPPIYPHLAQPT